MDYSRPDLADRLAAEHVAGTLRGGARRRFESLLPAHPQLRAAVRAWQDRLMPLTLVVAPIEPPASVWQRIESRIDGASASKPAAAASSAGLVVAAGGVARAGGLRHHRGGRLGGAARVPQPAQPPMVVVLASTGGTTEGVNSFVASLTAPTAARW